MKNLSVVFLFIFLFPAFVFAVPSTNRTSGVAPMAVHFWADVPASSPENMPFHDYEYSWNFGDSTSETWGTSGKAKNTDKGPVAAHVYETPGTYTATLSVRNATGVVDTQTFTITVQDPNTVFAGTKTTCISTTADFTGCPAGAAQVTSSDLSSLAGYTDAGERVLLRRGSTWTVSSQPNFPSNAGPVHIGAFGTCTSPDELGSCSNAPTINLNTTFLNGSLKQDWRLTDIKFVGAGNPFEGGRNIKNTLALRLNVSGGGSINSTADRANDSEWIEGLFVVSSRVINETVMTWIGGEKLVMMGNIHGSTGTTSSHIIRIWQSYQGVFSHNVAYGAGQNMHALKFHGPKTPPHPDNYMMIGDYATTGSTGLRNPSQFNVMANNIFGGGGSWTVGIGPQDRVSDERLQDIIFEKNRILADYRNQSTTALALNLIARYTSVRNNVMVGTGLVSEFVGINAYNDGIVFNSGNIIGLSILNNTFYSNTAHSGEFYGMRLHNPSVYEAIVRNNLVSAPNALSTKTVIDPARVGTGTIQSNNVYTNTPCFVDPNNTNPLLRNYALTSSASASIGQGTLVPVFDDFNSSSRRLPYDVGAFQASPRRIFRNVRVGEVEP